MDDIESARWQGGVDAKLDTLISRLDKLAESKDIAHEAIHAKIDLHNTRIDVLESKWDRLLGAAVGVGIGAGAVGGGVGALVTSLIG